MKRIDIVPLEGRELQIGLLLAMLENATALWRGQLGSIPQEAIVWQPYEGGHNIGAVILHIIDVEAFWLHEVATGFERSPEELKTLLSHETDQGAGKWPPPPNQPLEWYYAQQDAIRERTRTLLKEMSNPESTHEIDKSEEREFTLRWLLHHTQEHEAYHGGQVVLLFDQYCKQKALGNG